MSYNVLIHIHSVEDFTPSSRAPSQPSRLRLPAMILDLVACGTRVQMIMDHIVTSSRQALAWSMAHFAALEVVERLHMEHGEASPGGQFPGSYLPW